MARRPKPQPIVLSTPEIIVLQLAQAIADDYCDRRDDRLALVDVHGTITETGDDTFDATVLLDFHPVVPLEIKMQVTTLGPVAAQCSYRANMTAGPSDPWSGTAMRKHNGQTFLTNQIPVAASS